MLLVVGCGARHSAMAVVLQISSIVWWHIPQAPLAMAQCAGYSIGIMWKEAIMEGFLYLMHTPLISFWNRSWSSPGLCLCETWYNSYLLSPVGCHPFLPVFLCVFFLISSWFHSLFFWSSVFSVCLNFFFTSSYFLDSPLHSCFFRFFVINLFSYCFL